jgi:hypothetical protein
MPRHEVRTERDPNGTIRAYLDGIVAVTIQMNGHCITHQTTFSCIVDLLAFNQAITAALNEQSRRIGTVKGDTYIPREGPINTLSEAHIVALARFVVINGRHWRKTLADAWTSGIYPRGHIDTAALRQIHDNHGPALISRLSRSSILTAARTVLATQRGTAVVRDGSELGQILDNEEIVTVMFDGDPVKEFPSLGAALEFASKKAERGLQQDITASFDGELYYLVDENGWTWTSDP